MEIFHTYSINLLVYGFHRVSLFLGEHGSPIYRPICPRNQQKTIQTNPMAPVGLTLGPWDPVGLPLEPFNPGGLPINHLGPRRPTPRPHETL